MYSHTHTYTHPYTLTHIRIHTLTHIHTHTHIHSHSYTYTQIHSHTHTHTLARTHTGTFFLTCNEGGTNDSKERLCPEGRQRLWWLTVWLLACGECGRFVHFKTKSSWKRVRGAIPFLSYSFVKKL